MLSQWRHVGSEVARALVVLALVFLSFAHAPVAVYADGADLLTATIDAGWCGDSPDTGEAHAPCHACRLGAAADVPAPPCLPTAAHVVAMVGYHVRPALQMQAEPMGTATARGPPSLV